MQCKSYVAIPLALVTSFHSSYFSKEEASFVLKIACIFLFYAYFEGGVSHEVFPCFLGCIKQHFLLYFRLYLGDLWSYYQDPLFSNLRFNGSARIISPPLTILSIRLIFPNLGTLINYLGPLVKLGPVGLMGPHV